MTSQSKRGHATLELLFGSDDHWKSHYPNVNIEDFVTRDVALRQDSALTVGLPTAYQQQPSLGDIQEAFSKLVPQLTGMGVSSVQVRSPIPESLEMSVICAMLQKAVSEAGAEIAVLDPEQDGNHRA